jgi:hypothetical protein
MPKGFTWKYLGDAQEKEEREKHWYYWESDVVSQRGTGEAPVYSCWLCWLISVWLASIRSASE